MHPSPSFIRPVGKTRTELWSGLWTGLNRPFFFYGSNFFVFVFVLFFLFWGGGGEGGCSGLDSGLDRTSSPNRESTYVLSFHSL